MRTTTTTLATFVVLVLARQTTATPVHWNISEGGNGHYYEQVLQNLTWQEARDAADLLTFNGLQGYMVTITSADEQNFLISQFPGHLAGGSFWLGGFQNLNAPDYTEPAGGWRWITGEPFVYTNWNQNPIEPNDSGGSEAFLDTYGSVWNWNDNVFSIDKTGFYVEYSTPIPEPSTFILTAFALLGIAYTRRKRR